MRTYVLNLTKPHVRYPSSAHLDLKSTDLANYNVRGTSDNAHNSPMFLLPFGSDISQKNKELLAVEESKTQNEIKPPFSKSHQITGQPLRDEVMLPPAKKGQRKGQKRSASKSLAQPSKMHKSKPKGPFRVSST